MPIQRLNGEFNSEIEVLVREKLYNEGIDKETFQQWAQKGFVYGFIQRDKLLGFILCLEYPTFIYVMAIATTVDQAGIGSALLKYAVLNHPKDFWVKIRLSNLPSLALFKKYGFVKQTKKDTPCELQKSYRTEYYPFLRQKSKYYLGQFDLYLESARLQDFQRNL